MAVQQTASPRLACSLFFPASSPGSTPTLLSLASRTRGTRTHVSPHAVCTQRTALTHAAPPATPASYLYAMPQCLPGLPFVSIAIAHRIRPHRMYCSPPPSSSSSTPASTAYSTSHTVILQPPSPVAGALHPTACIITLWLTCDPIKGSNVPLASPGHPCP